jgi:putative oxidoreductase
MDTASLIGRLSRAAVFPTGSLGKAAVSVITTGYMAAMGRPFPISGFVLAVVVEIGGRLLRVLGRRTRIAALLMIKDI